MIETEQTEQRTGPITPAEIEAAYDGGATNAGLIRRAVGRGSLSTIQKHLDAIRERRRAAARGEQAQGGETVPDAPEATIEAIWREAWGAAVLAQHQRLAAAHEAAEAARAALADARADLEAAQQAADEAAQAADEAVQVRDRTQQAADEARIEAETARAAVMESARQAEIQAARHEAETAALRGEVDRLVQQLADLRAMMGTGRQGDAGGGQWSQ